MSLATPIAIRTLQRKLYRKAKAGAPGVDGKTFYGNRSAGLGEVAGGPARGTGLEGVLPCYHLSAGNRCWKPQPPIKGLSFEFVSNASAHRRFTRILISECGPNQRCEGEQPCNGCAVTSPLPLTSCRF